MSAIYRKEIKSYFNSPIGYVIMAAFLVISGYFFAATLFSALSDMRYVFSNMIMMFVFIIPILTMRLIAEEKNAKTDQLLLTSPVSITSIVLGKFLAALTVIGIALLFTVIYPVILSRYASVEWAQILGSYIGFILLASAYISIGVFISSLTENQIISAICTFAVLLLLYLSPMLLGSVSNEIVAKILSWISLSSKYDGFSTGIVNIADVVYYISIAAVFIFLTARHLEKRRWSK